METLYRVAPGAFWVMLMLMPMLEGECMPPTTGLGVSWHSDGALSRRQPGAARQGLGAIVESRNRSSRTEVTSTPHLLFLLRVSVTPEWQPAGVCGERSVQAGPRVIVWPAAAFVTLKCPAQFAPFMSQNCGFATDVLAGAAQFSSSGAFSSLDSRLPVASDV